MHFFCRFARTAGPLQKSIPQSAARSFTATAQVNKYQVPKSKQQKEPIMATTTLKGQPFDRPVLDSMLRRRLFYTPSFEVYGGVAGLYDYGPVSCSFLSPSPLLPSPHNNLMVLPSGCLDTTAVLLISSFSRCSGIDTSEHRNSSAVKLFSPLLQVFCTSLLERTKTLLFRNLLPS